jgi:hypothetical protein
MAVRRHSPASWFAAALVFAGIVLPPSTGWSAGLDEDPRVLPFLPHLSRNVTRERFLDNVISAYRQVAGNRDSIGPADVETATRIDSARRRANWLSRIWAADLDNDGRVTRDEIAALAQQPETQSRNDSDFLSGFDRNGDGIIDFEETRRGAAERLEQGPQHLTILANLLALQPGRDGRLTRSEAQARAEKAFDLVDANHDTSLSQEELEPLQAAIRVAALPPCPLPKADKNLQVVLFSAYEGEAISTATVGGQDVDTHVISVVIEPGKEKLYLILAAHGPTIWRLSGAVDRVAMAAVSSSTHASANGVTGIDRDRVAFLSRGGCPGYVDAKNPREGEVARGMVRKAIGRAPDVANSVYGVTEVRLPSAMVAAIPGTPPAPPAGFDPALWQAALHFNPGGLLAVDPASVVADTPAQAYNVLPAEFGLAQQVGNGTLIRTGDRQFTIVRPLARFPAGQNGAHSVSYVVAKGVPMPGGSPGHSCVREEATDKPAPGARECR